MDSSQWLMLLQPLLVLLVPLILSQAKKLLGDTKWTVVIPIAAPILAVIADQVQGLATGGTLGIVQSAVLGAVGVFVREIVNQTKKGLTQALLLFILIPALLTSCATSEQVKVQKSLDVTGTALEVAGQQFVEIGKFFNQALDAKLITNDQYRTWAAFAKKFKQGFPPAVSAYKVAVSAGNLTAASDVEASIQPLIAELGVFAIQVYKVLNKPTAWVIPEHATDIVASLPEKGGGQRMTLAGPQLDPVALLILYSVGTPPPAVAR